MDAHRRSEVAESWVSWFQMTQREPEESPGPKRHISRRTAQLPLVSKVLYRIDHYSSMPAVAITGVFLLIVFLVIGAVLGFPNRWVVAFEVSVAAVTLMMVFTIQHTQGREQAATQRKLDELLRAVPGAAASLMMLEEAPKATILGIEDEQREVRSESVETGSTGVSSGEPFDESMSPSDDEE